MAPFTSLRQTVATHRNGVRRRDGYSERARRRLRIAAGLLQLNDLSVDRLGEGFCPAVLSVIHALDEPRQEQLRGLVDWVEAYELEEDRQFGRSHRGA